MYPYLTTTQVKGAVMSIQSLNRVENRERVARVPLEHANLNRNILRADDLRDRFETWNIRDRELQRGVGGTGTTGVNNGHGTGNNGTGDLIDTARVELEGAGTVLTSRIESPPPSPPSLPPGELKVNEDGSITTPGGYTIYNDGNYQWRVKSPSGIESRIYGDPHVDEDNDGHADWHFNQDGTFVLPDGTKIFCDTTEAGAGITVSDNLKIQYGDSLGSMDVKNGGAGTVTDGGLAYDSSHGEGQIFVMGNDFKWYDGETLGKLYDAGGDFARDVDGNTVGVISENALITLNKSLGEEGLALKAANPTGGLEGVGGRAPTAEELAMLLALEDNAFLVDDSDGEVAAAAAARRRINAANIIGQANQAVNGYEGLRDLDKNGDGVVSGTELDGVKVWIDANQDGNADESEIKLLAEFHIDALKVKIALQHNEDGTTDLEGHFEQNGAESRTNDRITPLDDGAQGINFQRELNDHVGENRRTRVLAQRQLDRALDRLDVLSRQERQERRTGDLRNEANRQRRYVNTGEGRA